MEQQCKLQKSEFIIIEDFNDIRNPLREKYISFVKKEIRKIKKYIDGAHSKKKRLSRGIFTEITPRIISVDRINKVELIEREDGTKELLAFRVKFFNAFSKIDYECVISLIKNQKTTYGKIVSLWEKSNSNATRNKNHKKIQRKGKIDRKRSI